MQLGAARLRIEGLCGWRRAAAATAAGAASVLAMAPFFCWPVLFITLPVLVWLIDGSGPVRSIPVTAAGSSALSLGERIKSVVLRRGIMRAAAAGWWFGFGYFVVGLYWIGEAFLVEAEKFAWLLPFAVTLLPAGLAVFYALAAGLAHSLWGRGAARLFALALALALAEWLRGHVLSGFPWNTLGYALTSPLPLMQAAALCGIYGLTLWAVVIFSAPLVIAADPGRTPPGSVAGVVLAFVSLAGFYGYGLLRLARPPAPAVADVHLRLVQPSVPQREKWLPEKQRDIFLDHLDLSRRNASGQRDDLAGVTHLVWPEAAMPFLPLDTPDALAAIGELLPADTSLLTGALRVAKTSGEQGAAPQKRRVYNSLIVLDGEGRPAAVYDKIHLVPFGEFLPLQATLEAIGLEQLTRIRGGFTVGEQPRPLLRVAGLPPVAGLICYEAIFPGAIVQGPERPGLLLNVTNDGWFGASIGPHQHFHQARVRAVEEGLPLVRAANNGISAVIDADGRVLHRLGLDERGTLDSVLPMARAPTPYAQFGDLVFLANALLFAGVWWLLQAQP